MSDAFSSQEAEEKGEQDYETLEEYIFQTQRDKDKEIGKAMRFRSWQEMQLRIIKNKIGTNAVEVVARSYLMGLSRLREEHQENVEDAGDMLTKFLMVVGKDPRNTSTINHIGDTISDYEIDEPYKDEASLGDPRNYKVRQSAVSEVENNYVQDSFFGPWIHRYVAALGFLDSEFVTDVTEDKLSSFSSAVAESVEDAREEIESLIMDYISMSQAHWIDEGLDRETYEALEDVVGHMKTDYAHTCEKLLENSQQFIEENNEQE